MAFGDWKIVDGKLKWVEKPRPKQVRKFRTCPRCAGEYLGAMSCCHDCRNADKRIKNARNNGFKPWEHYAAYTHVLRHERTGDLFKFSIMQTPSLPKDYEIVYKVNMAGVLLPRRYAKLESYHEVKEILDKA